MKRFVLIVLLSSLPALQAGEICSSYINTGPLTVPSDGDNLTFDITSIVSVPVPLGATGIVGWKFGTEFPRDAKLRAVMWLQWEGNNDFNHYATRTPSQEATFLPSGDWVEIVPDRNLQLRFRVFNEGSEPIVNVKGNLWVWFKMGN